MCLLTAALSQGNEPLQLVIEGEDNQNCIVTIRYIRTRQVVKSLVTRLPLISGQATEAIESPHEGIEIWIQSASAPLAARLIKDTAVIHEERLDEPGFLKIGVGKPGPAGFSPAPIELSQPERALVQAIDEAFISQSSTQPHVSTASNSKIDWPSLDILLREISRLIGGSTEDRNRDSAGGWIAWNDTDGTRMLAGVLHGENGNCGLTLSLDGQQIIDVNSSCEPLADDYYREPLDHTYYASQAERLTRHLFAEEAESAHQLYAPQFQKDVSVQQLRELSSVIRERYGKNIISVEFKRTDLSAYNFAQGTQLLQLDHIVTLDSGKRCVSRVVFNIPSSRTQVGKANLGAINIYEVFSSSHPDLAQTTQQLIDQIALGISAEDLIKRLHPILRQAAKKSEIDSTVKRIGQYLTHKSPEIDFDLWTVLSTDGWLQASGPVNLGSEKGFMEFHFLADGQLLGFSAFGPALAESTLGSIQFDPIIPKTAQQFWGYLLREDARAAHKMLAPEFQEQFPLSDLQAQLEAVNESPTPVKQINVDTVRLTTHVDRVRAIMATVFLTVHYDDDSTQSLACELAWPMPSDPIGTKLVYDFSNDFDFDFPVSTVPIAGNLDDGAAVFIQALLNEDSQAILELVDPSKRAGVDLPALNAYLKQFKNIAGQAADPISLSRVAEYVAGNKQIRCNGIFINEASDAIPLEIWFRYGYLERFSISHPSMLEFVTSIDDTKESERRIRGFIKYWFTDLPRSQLYLTSSLRTEVMMKTLEQARSEFVSEHGRLSSLSLAPKRPSGGSGSLEFEVTLQGARSEKNIKLNMDFGAFGGLISGIEF
jgi:hypothetical protein